ncbi:MAG: hypothetical protein FJZ63_04970 [Chlamydiae bacterium]|nr:hypothetical protein [Chlamydiota bacterium]
MASVVKQFVEPICVHIFSSPACSQESIEGLTYLMERLFQETVLLREKSAEELIIAVRERTLGRKKQLVVFPGSMTLKEWGFLGGHKDELLKLFKEDKLLMMGVCAGAFFLSKESVFNKREREHTQYIPAFQGRVVGSLREGLVPFGVEGYPITTEAVSCFGLTAKVAVLAGGYFEKLGEGDEVLASIEDKPVVIACSKKEAHYRALLITTHFELGLEALQRQMQVFPQDISKVQTMQSDLQESHTMRLQMMRLFLEKLGLK